MPSPCPDAHRLRGLLEGGVSESEATLLTSHLDLCRQCQHRLEALTGAADLIPSQAQEPPATSRTLERVITALKAAYFQGTRGHQPDQLTESQCPRFLGRSDKPGYIGKFGPYEVIRVVGHGGMGVVLQAYDPSLDRIVAIKVLSAQLASSEEARKRFSREARAAAAVVHDNIVAIYSVDETAGFPYLVMPFVSGGSVQERIDQTGALPLDNILRIGHQIALGLAAAHARGLVHRDIKPANILIDQSSDRIKIADFGLARACDELPITQTGFLAGTPQYMAPEQAMEQRVDHRADLFSLGSVLYVMCTGTLPFPQQRTIAAIRSVCDDSPPPIREVNPVIPQWLAQTVDRLMAKDPARRIQSAQQIVELFEERLIATTSSSSRSDDTPTENPNRRNSRRTIIIACILLTLTAGALITAIRVVNRVDHETTNLPLTASTNQPARTDLSPPPLTVVATPAYFTILSASDSPPVQFDTLSETVAQSTKDDTIEIHGNGDVPIEPIQIQDKPLVIRAAEGFEPTLVPALASTAPLITTDSTLVLGGLAFRNIGTTPGTRRWRSLQRSEVQGGGATEISAGSAGTSLIQTSGLLYATNCRFLAQSSSDTDTACLIRRGQSLTLLNNCELYVQQGSAVYVDESVEKTIRQTENLSPENVLVIHNSVQAGFAMFSLGSVLPGDLRLSQNSFAGGCLAAYRSQTNTSSQPKPALRIQATDNVFDVRSFLIDPSSDKTALSTNHIQWQGQHNAFSTSPSLSVDLPRRNNRVDNPNQLWDWKNILGSSINVSVHGDIVYSSSKHPFEQITSGNYHELSPEIFHVVAIRKRRGRRLKANALKQLGAVTSTVGPGRAYELFKQSDAYQEWAETVRQTIPSAFFQNP